MERLVFARSVRTARWGALRVVLVVASLLFVSGFLLMACPREAQAASADSNTYYAEVKYYDGIQMKYIVRHGIDEYWTTTGDIPIGGFIDGTGNQLIDQAYCVDATVAFHGSDETETSWPSGVTTDTTTAGYVVASPLAVSDGVRANLPSLYWLAVNGFRGVRGGANNLADIRAEYADLETQYGTPIDETIAIMATKAAVWNFTDPTFALLSTSLNPDPANPTAEQKARYELMIALMKHLVTDARAGGPGLATITLDVAFDNSTAAFTSSADGGYFYGPVTASMQVTNGTGGTPEQIYLTASGMYAANFVFVDSASPIAVALQKATMYGSQTEAPYVNNGGSFYIKIPATDVANALVNIGQPSMNFAYLALHGFGRSADVTYSGTPAIMAWQGPAASSPAGEQDWGHVQAFIGFVNNIQASLYGEGHLFLRGNEDDASIAVSKSVLGATNASNAGSFVFTLEVYDNSLAQWVPVPLIPDTPGNTGSFNITGAHGLVSVSPGGVFSLADGDTATITGLPLGQYRVSERESADGYTTVSQLDSNAAVEGSAADVPLTLQSPSRAVGFTNTIIPQTPNTPVTPIVPNTPGNTTELPPTGDHGAHTGILALLLALGGLCLGGLGLAARRSKGAQHVVSPSPRM
jgi:hypothetical protein